MRMQERGLIDKRSGSYRRPRTQPELSKALCGWGIDQEIEYHVRLDRHVGAGGSVRRPLGPSGPKTCRTIEPGVMAMSIPRTGDVRRSIHFASGGWRG